MNLTYKQATRSSKKANKINKYNEIDCVFEHILKCKSCLWEITIYESKGTYLSTVRKYIALFARKKK
ncbi:MAG: hypothetical protein ACTHKF_10895 [Candidatus Nitrosocosmicus sp.]